jgi:hypothetical protein
MGCVTKSAVCRAKPIHEFLVFRVLIRYANGPFPEPCLHEVRGNRAQSSVTSEPFMYRFSRTLYLELKDLVDPHPDTISVAEARRRVLEAAQSTVERLASDPRYFPQPARSLFQQIRCYFPISQQAHVFYAIERMVSLARASIQIELDRLNEANARCRATTRKGKACQRTPLPGREYCPSHSHLEEPSTMPSRVGAAA